LIARSVKRKGIVGLGSMKKPLPLSLVASISKSATQ